MIVVAHTQGVSNAAALHTHRANVYRLLADAYLPPAEPDAAALAILPGALQSAHPAAVPLAEALLAALPNNARERSRFAVAHAKLFVGPFDLLAPPYGSVYLDGERRVMGESTMEVMEHYAAVGLDPESEIGELPDHITTELEFMYFLAFRHAATGEEPYLARQRDFLSAHLRRWISGFAARVRGADVHAFYTCLASLTERFVVEDAVRLRHLVTDPRLGTE